ncbi:MAG: 50S ribosomal protein L28 [Candidatus Levybacteria bacterium RIFCSPLOWO2_12_FULL_37_14]|nr:MAG: 50S ribosomal protein L28 [Candidatus Levybacteria bacterium RIFCSPLOWO2_12_FULL_37_14]
MKCQNCGKGSMYGHKVSHAKNRTKRLFRPNLHPMRLTVNGATKRVKLCTKCLRTAKKEIKAKSAPKIASSAQAAATV